MSISKSLKNRTIFLLSTTSYRPDSSKCSAKISAIIDPAFMGLTILPRSVLPLSGLAKSKSTTATRLISGSASLTDALWLLVSKVVHPYIVVNKIIGIMNFFMRTSLIRIRFQVSGVRCQQKKDIMQDLIIPDVIGFLILTPEH